MRHLVSSPHRRSREALLATRARALRSGLNAPQLVLWRAVAGGRLGVYFRREVVLLGRYIVDMLAPSLKLVVEVDGRCHQLKRGADARRDRALAQAGYTVVRVDAHTVLRALPVALGRLKEVVGRLSG